MLLQVNPDVYDQEDDIVMRQLDHLLILLESGQHEWVLLENSETLLSKVWPTQLSARHKKILEEVATKAFVNSANITAKEKDLRGVWEIAVEGDTSLSNIIRSLQSPLYIVVENETSDPTFLNRLLDIYPIPGNQLKTALEKHFLEYYPAGGRNEIVKTLKNLKHKRPMPFRPRIFVFIDSDKRFPGQEHSNDLQEIVEYCSSESIPLHITYKREIENYLTKEVLEAKLPDEFTDTLEEFLKLSPDQWDFFDLEKGFGNTPPEENGLYGNYNGRKNQSYLNLRYGFTSKEFKAKKELYLFFQDENFNTSTVTSRCSHQPDSNELLNLLLNISYKL